MIRIGACDDATAPLCQLESACRRWTDISCFRMVFQRFHSIEELLAERELRGHFDIVFIGLLKQTQSAAESVRAILREDEETSIVLLLGRVQSLGCLPTSHPYYFLQAPSAPPELGAFFHTYLRDRLPLRLMYQYKRFYHFVPVREILYLEHSRRKIYVNLRDGRQGEFIEKLDTIERFLTHSVYPFLRIHESYLISFRCVRTLNQTEVVMENGERLPVSERYRGLLSSLLRRLDRMQREMSERPEAREK